MDRKEYVCNQMYKQHALLRKDSWTDADKLEYMELNIAPYSRYWRMGMKKALKHAIKLLREEEAKADRKTEPSNSEFPNNSTISKMEQVEDEPQTDNPLVSIVNGWYCKTCKHLTDKDCDCDVVFTGYEPKDEPQTDCYDCAHWDYQREVCCRGGGCEFKPQIERSE